MLSKGMLSFFLGNSFLKIVYPPKKHGYAICLVVFYVLIECVFWMLCKPMMLIVVIWDNCFDLILEWFAVINWRQDIVRGGPASPLNFSSLPRQNRNGCVCCCRTDVVKKKVFSCSLRSVAFDERASFLKIAWRIMEEIDNGSLWLNK